MEGQETVTRGVFNCEARGIVASSTTLWELQVVTDELMQEHVVMKGQGRLSRGEGQLFVTYYVFYSDQYQLPQIAFGTSVIGETDEETALPAFFPKLHLLNFSDNPNPPSSLLPMASFSFCEELRSPAWVLHPCDTAKVMHCARLDGLRGGTLTVFLRYTVGAPDKLFFGDVSEAYSAMLRRSLALWTVGGQGPFNPYKILGVAPNASKEEVKRAYHRLALRYHPDGGPEGNADRFAAVHEAYEAVKDGKWKPSAEQQRSSMHEGQGWDPKMRVYVYEKPGSTTENYVDSHTQSILRLAMVWCFLFIAVRFFLLSVFPNVQRPQPEPPLQALAPAGEASTAQPAAGRSATVSRLRTPSASVHDDEEEETVTVDGSHFDSVHADGATTFVDEPNVSSGQAVDPLTHRRFGW